MKICVTIESDAYQYSENGYATDRYSAVYDADKLTVQEMLDFSKRMLGKSLPLNRHILSEVVEQ